MHHSWLYCIGAGLLMGTIIGGAIAIIIGVMILWFTLWEKFMDGEDAGLYGLLSAIFIAIATVGTLVCKGVIK